MICPTKKHIKFKARLSIENESYPSFTNSLCEDGLYLRTFPQESELNIASGSVVQVKLEPPGKESVCLNCRVKWSYKTPPHGLTNSVGVEILDALPNYDELLRDLL